MKTVGLKEMLIILLILPPVNVSVLIGIWCAVNGFSFLFTTEYGFDAFISGAVIWFVIIYVCKIGLLALTGIFYGIVKLFKRLMNSSVRIPQ